MTDRDTALREAAEEYQRWAEGPQTEDHDTTCGYRMRTADCSCGTFRTWTSEANDAADRLAAGVLSAPSTEASGEGLPTDIRALLIYVRALAEDCRTSGEVNAAKIVDGLGDLIEASTFVPATDPSHSTADHSPWRDMTPEEWDAAAAMIRNRDAVHIPDRFAATDPSHPTAEPGLDAAWAEAEAALPEGWAIENLRHTAMMDQRWQAEAGSRVGPVVQWNKIRTVIAEGPTPAAALLALAARLRRDQHDREA